MCQHFGVAKQTLPGPWPSFPLANGQCHSAAHLPAGQWPSEHQPEPVPLPAKRRALPGWCSQCQHQAPSSPPRCSPPEAQLSILVPEEARLPEPESVAQPVSPPWLPGTGQGEKCSGRVKKVKCPLHGGTGPGTFATGYARCGGGLVLAKEGTLRPGGRAGAAAAG